MDIARRLDISGRSTMNKDRVGERDQEGQPTGRPTATGSGYPVAAGGVGSKLSSSISVPRRISLRAFLAGDQDADDGQRPDRILHRPREPERLE